VPLAKEHSRRQLLPNPFNQFQRNKKLNRGIYGMFTDKWKGKLIIIWYRLSRSPYRNKTSVDLFHPNLTLSRNVWFLSFVWNKTGYSHRRYNNKSRYCFVKLYPFRRINRLNLFFPRLNHRLFVYFVGYFIILLLFGLPWSSLGLHMTLHICYT